MEAVASRRTQLHGLVSSLHLALGAKRPASWQLPARSTPPYLPYQTRGCCRSGEPDRILGYCALCREPKLGLSPCHHAAQEQRSMDRT